MYPLLFLSVFLYYSGFEICFRMARLNSVCADSRKFRGAYRDFVSSEFSGSGVSDVKTVFGKLRIELLSGVERRIATVKILSGVAPLIGLLGTVSGMMLSISSASGGDTSSNVADGISTALITTQAGLVVAIPAWIMAMFAASQVQKLLVGIARREAALIREGSL